MFVLNDDLSIYATRGDIVFFTVTAEDDGVPHVFKAGDVVRIKIYGKKNANDLLLQKDFPVVRDCESVEIFLSKDDTKMGEVISKPKDYWYEVVLNDDTKPQTIIGYDDDGAKVFKLFPEGKDLEQYIPDAEDIPFVDTELDMTSPRPLQNQAIARAIVSLRAGFEDTNNKTEETAEALDVERSRLDNLIAHKVTSLSQNLAYLESITEETKAKIDGTIESDGAFATIKVNLREANLVYDGTTFDLFVVPAECRPIEMGLIHNEDGIEYRISYDETNKRYILSLKGQSGISVAPSEAGSVTMTYALGNHELLDIRIGADGKTYRTAGEAVREQIVGVDAVLIGEFSMLLNREIEAKPELYDGFAKYASGTVSNDSFDGFYKRTGFVYIPSLCVRIEHNFEPNDIGVDGIAFYDNKKQYITGYKSNGIIDEIPVGTRYIVFSNYDFSRVHDGKYIRMFAKEEQKEELNDSGIKTLVTFGDSHVARGLWQQKVLDSFNIEEHINLGIGGSTVAVNPSATVLPFVADERLEAIKSADADTIIVIGGTNDVHLETPLGKEQDLAATNKDKTTFYGAYGYLVEELLRWKPSLKIVLCTTPQGIYDNIHPVKYAEISRAIKNIAYHYSLPVADIFGECGINKTNLNTYSDDLIHYNTLGNERVSAVIVNAIKGSYVTNK